MAPLPVFAIGVYCSPLRLRLRRLLIFTLIVALAAVSTAVVAHGHEKASEEAHCSLCLAMHSASRAVVLPAPTLFFSALRSAMAVRPPTLAPAVPRLRQVQDRAPPAV